jgi:hypothetical protein
MVAILVMMKQDQIQRMVYLHEVYVPLRLMEVPQIQLVSIVQECHSM